MKNALTELIEIDEQEKGKRGILYTPLEIAEQVTHWESTYNRFLEKKSKIGMFIQNFIKKGTETAICTGAGTSEFIGYCIEGLLRKKMGIPVNVFSTTRIVTNPDSVLMMNRPVLLISFARSGNSPESIGAVKIAEMFSNEVQHLIITCNETGELNKWAQGKENSLSFCLDKKTNDMGLAMTSSFSNMVIAGQMLSLVDKLDEYADYFKYITDAGKTILETAPDIVREVCSLEFNRAVFLGSGSNYGTAIESHLKLQELTAGAVMCAYDTFPGLRHGPEAVINENTLVVAYVSGSGFIKKYELDLLKEIREKKIGRALLVVCDSMDNEISGIADYTIHYDPDGSRRIDDDLLPPVFIIVGQLLGLFKSIEMGCKPDTPSETGIIHRVVKGVKVYNPLLYNQSGIFDIISER